MNDKRTIFLLGATGFIGSEVLREAVGAGWRVKALTRSPDSAAALEAAGAEPVVGAAESPESLTPVEAG